MPEETETVLRASVCVASIFRAAFPFAAETSGSLKPTSQKRDVGHPVCRRSLLGQTNGDVAGASLMPVGSLSDAESAMLPWLSVGGRHIQAWAPTVTSPMPPERYWLMLPCWWRVAVMPGMFAMTLQRGLSW